MEAFTSTLGHSPVSKCSCIPFEACPRVPGLLYFLQFCINVWGKYILSNLSKSEPKSVKEPEPIGKKIRSRRCKKIMRLPSPGDNQPI